MRPDAHCAPVPQGIYWVRGRREFVLSGPPALYSLVDHHLDGLLNGTSVEEIVAATGDEAARPVVEHIVRALVAQDVLIDLDAVDGPLPDPESAREHAELLAYLEANCAEPYHAFAAVRAARVAVLGAGPAAVSARRGLSANGTGEVLEHRSGSWPDGSAPPTLAVLIDDAEDALDLSAAGASLPPGTPVLPVAADASVAMVGPVCTSRQELACFRSVRDRAARWQRTGTETAAPRPLSAVLAGSLAAQAVLDWIAGIGDGTRTGLVVYGHAVQTRAVPIPDPGNEPAWRDVDVAEVLATEAAAPAEGTTAEPGDPIDAQRVHQLAAPLTSRWTGVLRWGPDLDLPQLPVSLVTAETVPGLGMPESGACVLGWGTNRSAAGVTAMLSVLRDLAAAEHPESADAVPAAGLTRARWVVDGLLRGIGPRELAGSAGTELAWDELKASPVRSMWSLLRDFFDVPVELRLRTVSGLDWSLVSAVHRGTGEVLATEWGPSPLSAGYAALLAATGRAQFGAAEKTSPQPLVTRPDPVGTWSLQVAPEQQVRDCLRQLLIHAEAEKRFPRAWLLVRDESAGELPIVCGRVALR